MAARTGFPKAGLEDWECPECANVNFGKRTECNRCKKPKPEDKGNVKKTGIEIGKQAAEKSKGLFSADDWMCTKCGNVNWARRKTCNTCNAPKFTEVEERTGLGGGFNEREGVEYKAREESDDEFDDFGRKKKKMRPSTDESDSHRAEKFVSGSVSRKTTDARDESEEKESEEEEEEDDDGDIDKYNLFDDDDDEDVNSKQDDEKAGGSGKNQTKNSSRKGNSHSSDEEESRRDQKKVLSPEKRPRKRYPGSRSSDESSSSSSSRSSTSSSSSSSSSSSHSSKNSPSPRTSSKKNGHG